MAEILNHRCICGWEQTGLALEEDYVAEIGHGIPPWSAESRVAAIPQRRLAFGYSGVLFNAGSLLDGNDGQKASARLLSGLAQSPEKGLTSLEGAFVAALAREKELMLIRDQAGIKALYWTRHRDRLVFASEIKALFADPSVPRKMRIAALPEYLTFSFVPGENTMFENIYELQPGTTLTYQNGQIAKSRHFCFENTEWDQDAPARMRPMRIRSGGIWKHLCGSAARSASGPRLFFSPGGLTPARCWRWLRGNSPARPSRPSPSISAPGTPMRTNSSP